MAVPIGMLDLTLLEDDPTLWILLQEIWRLNYFNKRKEGEDD